MMARRDDDDCFLRNFFSSENGHLVTSTNLLKACLCQAQEASFVELDAERRKVLKSKSQYKYL